MTEPAAKPVGAEKARDRAGAEVLGGYAAEMRAEPDEHQILGPDRAVKIARIGRLLRLDLRQRVDEQAGIALELRQHRRRAAHDEDRLPRHSSVSSCAGSSLAASTSTGAPRARALGPMLAANGTAATPDPDVADHACGSH